MNTCFWTFKATWHFDRQTATRAILFLTIINVHQSSSKLIFEFFSMIILLHFFLFWIEAILVEKKVSKAAVWFFLHIFFTDFRVDFQSCFFRARVHFTDPLALFLRHFRVMSHEGWIWCFHIHENRHELKFWLKIWNIIMLKVSHLKWFLHKHCIRFKK